MLKLLWIACALCIPAFAQVDTALPAETTITNLSGHAQEFDKHLVRVHAVLVFGWEGDNFLLDPSIPAPLYMPSRDPAAVWFYSQAGRDQQVYSPMGGQRIVYGVFEGYFHYPNAKGSDGGTALRAAAGNPLVVEKLLAAGADPTIKDKYGNTVDSESCERGDKGHARVCALVRQALEKK